MGQREHAKGKKCTGGYQELFKKKEKEKESKKEQENKRAGK